MLISCLIIVGIALLYSYLLHYLKVYDLRVAASIYQTQTGRRGASGVERSEGASSTTGLISPAPCSYGVIENGAAGKAGLTRLRLRTRIVRASLYAVSVAISFWLMLVAMTYNTYLFFSIVFGAFLGHVLYEDQMDVGTVLAGVGSKGLACH
ncbi:uncharacterized protein L203_102501 [Cryptococcus depauperatus CBS 7841]|uniref:Copper transport protein n=1 Tax=Cryptococcus depauperatus CBS 7841 TaxID=1295531 RepID=A0AAJ8JRY6_9TREE